MTEIAVRWRWLQLAEIKYITPIMDRTPADVDYARANQADLTNKNKGAWNYTDANRVCNNLLYAADHMYKKEMLREPYVMQIKTDWTEDDIITYEEINTMIVNNMNNLKTFSRPDLKWFDIALITNLDYNLANWLERNIHEMAHQEPMPEVPHKLTVEKGSGSGEYLAGTIVNIEADSAPPGMVFDHWSGNHLESVEQVKAFRTTFTMPHEDCTLTANYSDKVPHTFTVVTHTFTETVELPMGAVYKLVADPAPLGKVFYEWEVTPKEYAQQLYEPAATTHFTMPNEAVTIKAVYISKGEKQLIVVNGTGSGWYNYGTYVSVASERPLGTRFTTWSGDIQYLTEDPSEEYNVVKMPDKAVVRIQANWGTAATPPSSGGGSMTGGGGTGGGGGGSGNTSTGGNYVPSPPRATDLSLHVINGVIVNTEYAGSSYGIFDEGDSVLVTADSPGSGMKIDHWEVISGSVGFSHYDALSTTVYIRDQDSTIQPVYRPIEYSTLTVVTPYSTETYTQAEGTTIIITAEPISGKRFVKWTKTGGGDVSAWDKSTITYYFHRTDATLTAHYVNVWTVSVTDGTINGKSEGLFDEGATYTITTRNMETYEGFKGWTQSGEGVIRNTAATTTSFTVGAGDAHLTANIEEFPDKRLIVCYQNPDSGAIIKVSDKMYRYGSRIIVEAHIAPDKTTFLSWLGDVEMIQPSALASTVEVPSLTTDTSITATYFYPESPEYYTLSVYDGYPENGTYPAGSRIQVSARQPSENWEFHQWEGDTQFFVNPDKTQSTNLVIMPKKSITLKAKFKIIGEDPLYRISVTGGKASTLDEDADGNIYETTPSVYLDLPAKTEVKLTGDPDVVGWVFDRWDGNFEEAGVTDIIKTNNPTWFTMPEHDVEAIMVRRELLKYTVYPKNSTGPGTAYIGTYPIAGNLRDTEDYKYTFSHWTCVDADGNNCISAIKNPNEVETEITIKDRDLWIEAVYTTHYRLTVAEGQDTGDGYYYEGEEVNSVYADTPELGSGLTFDHWDDPVGVTVNKYDPTPKIIMKDSTAKITAVFTSIDAEGNSVIVTGEDVDDGLITRNDSYLINGVYSVGAITFDKEGCIGIVTEVDPDKNDDTDDYSVEKLFYGGNF